MRLTDFEPLRLDELAPATLASYKTKAGAAATAADAAGDVKTADKRFSGIVKATKKQFDQDAKGVSEDNLYGGRPDDEVKFFIDSEPAYYAVMDRFGDHIEFRGDDMVAPLRLWGAIQQTAGDAGGAADIAGLEDEPMWVGDELDEQGVAEGPKESYIIVRTDSEGKKDVFAGNFDTYERAQKELDDCLAHPLHTKYKQKFEIKRKGQEGVAEGILAELDMFAPRTVYFKMADGNYIKADYRGSEGLTGHKANDNVTFTAMSWVPVNTARSLGLDKFLAKGSDPSTTVSQNAQNIVGTSSAGEGPLGNRTIDVVDFVNGKEDAVPSALKTKVMQWVQKNTPQQQQGVAEDDDAVAAFLARGGEIQQLKPQRGPKRSGVGFASKHIGSASGRGNTKGKVSGLGANTGKAGKPVVTAEQGIAEDALAGMKRLAGIASVPAQTTPGQRQYRHMPTAVQPR